MVKKFLVIFLVLVLALPLAAAPKKKGKKSKKPRKKVEVEVPVNVGVGPAAFVLPEPIPGIHWGAQFQVYAAISPELIQQNKHKIPKKYRKLAQGIKDEVHMSPFPLPLIPSSFLVSPRDEASGKNHEAYGVFWSPLFSLGLLGFGNSQEFLSFKTGVGLPSLMYLQLNHPDIQGKDAQIFGLGADAYAALNMRFNPKVHLQFGAKSQAYLTNEFEYLENNKEQSTHFMPVHRAFVTFNYRFGYKTKI